MRQGTCPDSTEPSTHLVKWVLATHKKGPNMLFWWNCTSFDQIGVNLGEWSDSIEWMNNSQDFASILQDMLIEALFGRMGAHLDESLCQSGEWSPVSTGIHFVTSYNQRAILGFSTPFVLRL